jgi:hypothetical protein
MSVHIDISVPSYAFAHIIKLHIKMDGAKEELNLKITYCLTPLKG